MDRIAKLEDIKQATTLTVKDLPFYIVPHEGGVRLFSLVCPHMGATVEDCGDQLICPVHKWKFDRETGESVVGSKGLREIPVEIREGYIYAEINEAAPTLMPVRFPKSEVLVKMHSHACLEFIHEGCSLLTDPWLEGPAFHGAWMHYPHASAKVSDLHPDFILITHEHSDHCHIPSLKKFDKSIPLYFPAFPNGRMDHLLEELGFINLQPMLFGQEYSLTEELKITCYDPTSNWNDSIQLIALGDYRVLNLNDAGVNRRIAKLVTPVDLLCAAFGSGASGYPLCWTHLDKADSDQVLKDQFAAKQEMLKQASKLYGCDKIISFASYFALWQPEHQEFQKLLSEFKINPFDIRCQLARDRITVLDMLPGESYETGSKKFSKKDYDRKNLFSWPVVKKEIEKYVDETRVLSHIPSGYVYDSEKVRHYFLRLAEVPEIQYLKNYAVAIKVLGDAPETLTFNFDQSGVSALAEGCPVNLEIEIPEQFLMHLVETNCSWDELYIGYWIRMHNEKPYSVAFWRLLQAPYYLKGRVADQGVPAVTNTMSIASLLEMNKPVVSRILTRHGLYCVGCDRAPMESLHDGGLKHGLTLSEISDMVEEVNRVLLSEELKQDLSF